MLQPVTLLWNLIQHDWRLFWADRRAALLCFVVPILLASAFGAIFDQPSHRTGKVQLPISVVIEEDSLLIQAILQDLKASENLEIKVLSREESIDRIQQKDPSIAVVFPAGFSKQAMRMWQVGEKPSLELLHHPLSQMECQWAEGLLTEIIVKRLAKDALSGVLGNRSFDRPLHLERKSIPSSSNQIFNAYTHSFCGMTVQYLLFWGMESGLMILRERRRGLWRRLRTTPVSLSLLLVSRVISMAMIAGLQVLVTFTFGWLCFGVTISGGLPAFLVVAGAVSLLAAATGLFIATLGGTEARARSLCILVILGLSMIGGLWLPAFLLPHWLQDIANYLPTTWAMRCLDGVVWHGHWREFSTALFAVLGFSVGFLSIAVVRFCRFEALQRNGSDLT